MADPRLHDLRHCYASIAITQGETVLTIGRLPERRDPETTLKYTDMSPAMVREAIETVGAVLAGHALAARRWRPTDSNEAKLAPAARDYTVWDTRHAGLVDARLLPAFGSLPPNRIIRAGVNRRFDEYSLTAPGAADRASNLPG